MHKTFLVFLVLATILPAQGCGNRFWEDTKRSTGKTYDYVFDTAPTSRSFHDQASVPIEEINYRAANVLYANVGKYELSSRSPIYAKRFENHDDPTDTTIFGTVVMEQVVDRLVQRGMVITGGDPRPTDYFLPKGIEPEKYAKPTTGSLEHLPPRAAMLSGAYVIGDNFVYVSAKITRLDDRAVISAHTWTIPITDNVRQLLPQLRKDDGLDPSVKTSFN
ncbi:MAG: FlgO family outer membrane protein [Pseudomonadota bacterium]